jgi:hypothetical protein
VNTDFTGIIKWILVALSIPVVILMVRHSIQSARALSRRIDEYKAEQEAKKQQPGPVNPYSDMGALFGARTDKDNKDVRSK